MVQQQQQRRSSAITMDADVDEDEVRIERQMDHVFERAEEVEAPVTDLSLSPLCEPPCPPVSFIFFFFFFPFLLPYLQETISAYLSHFGQTTACPLDLPPSPKPLDSAPLPSLVGPAFYDNHFNAQQPGTPTTPIRSTCDLPTPCLTPSPSNVPASRPSSQIDGNFPLGQPALKVSFCSEEGETDVPPCFYVSLEFRFSLQSICKFIVIFWFLCLSLASQPGQTIPTTLLFELPRFTSLPHSLRPIMTMSLIGTLSCLGQPDQPHQARIEDKSLINVGVSLEEGLRLWGKDAGLGAPSFLTQPCCHF